MSAAPKKISEGIIQLPDGSIAFSLEKAAAEADKIMPVEYSVNDLILFLLNAQPEKTIRGRTAIFKEIFLMERELFGELLFRWEHVPGKDEHNLRTFLDKKLNMKWTVEAKITKSQKNAIRIFDSNHSSTIKINEEKTMATLTNDARHSWKPLYVFFVRIKGEEEIEILAKKHDLEECKFVPYFFGPYSFHVANKIENLVSIGLINKMGKKNTTTEEFKISSKGRKVIRAKYNNLPSKLRMKLEDMRKGLDQYGVDGILNDVYQNYNQFKEKSRIKNRYKLITWGRGKG